MIIASLYSKPVNKSIAFHYGQKNNGYSAFIPNTRYLVYQPRLTDAIIVIFGLLSYEHPCKQTGVFSQIFCLKCSIAFIVVTMINALHIDLPAIDLIRQSIFQKIFDLDVFDRTALHCE